MPGALQQLERAMPHANRQYFEPVCMTIHLVSAGATLLAKKQTFARRAKFLRGEIRSPEVTMNSLKDRLVEAHEGPLWEVWIVVRLASSARALGSIG